MIRQFLALCAGIALAGLALDTAACGPTCAPGQASCSSGNANGDAGASSDPTPTSCPQLTALRTCLDAYCKSADNPFCTCWKRGYDVDLNNCPSCIPFDSAKFCSEANTAGADAAGFNCPAASDQVSSLCVGVQ
ncbi:MAG: hypothetical protein ABJB12_21445 [Pseudomonadota bacterium]